jgi:hypothetical protein
MDAMSVGSAFGALTDLIERFEATGREVRRVITEDVAGEDAGETADDGDDPLTVDLSVRTPLFGNIETDGIDLDVRDATVNEDGTATVALSASIPIDSGGGRPRSGWEPRAGDGGNRREGDESDDERERKRTGTPRSRSVTRGVRDL